MLGAARLYLAWTRAHGALEATGTPPAGEPLSPAESFDASRAREIEAYEAELRADPEMARLLDLHREQLLRGLLHDHPERIATERALEARIEERAGLPPHPPVPREQVQAALRRKPAGA